MAYKTNTEVLLDAIRQNTAITNLTADTLALDVSVDGLETLQTAANGLLTTIDADTGALVIDLAAIEVLLEAANTDHAANEVLLTAIEATLETIKVDTEAIETLLGLAGSPYSFNSGNKNASTQRVVMANDSVPHALVNTNLGIINNNELLFKGNSGSVTISGDAAQGSISAGTYCAVYFIKNTTPTALTMTESTCVTGQLYAAGTWLYGDILTITGDSGGMYVLYKGNPTVI